MLLYHAEQDEVPGTGKTLSAQVAAPPVIELTPWHQVGLKDLTIFFLKCAIGSTPAVMLAVIMYVGFIIFNSVIAQVLGGF